jgi:structure-specific endonuclease subunit SLX1
MATSISHLQEEGKFFGCYLLVSEKSCGSTYIGFTVNPQRRIGQHNAGYNKGGAKRTSGKGPWNMVLIIHGFPNEISALRFEWAWQNPNRSLRLKHLFGTKGKQRSFQHRFNVVCEMLRTEPWSRLPLQIRWLKQEYQKEFQPNKMPPNHMPIVYGQIELIKESNKQKLDEEHLFISASQMNKSECCPLCFKSLLLNNEPKTTMKIIECLKCRQFFHTICLAKVFLGNKCLLPIDGDCPQCGQYLLWGDIIQLRRGRQIKGKSNKDDEDDCDSINSNSDDDDDDDDDSSQTSNIYE